jgi:hypothetical protein
MTSPSRRKRQITQPNTNPAKVPSRHWKSAAQVAVVFFLGLAGVANANEATGARGSKLQWRPVRPSQQTAINADEREARAERARIVNETKSNTHRVVIRSRDRQIDFHVRPAANLQPSRSGSGTTQPGADSAEPFGQPPTRSPFSNGAARQPTEATPIPDETPSVAQPRDADTPAFSGDEPSTRTEPREPGRLDMPEVQGRQPPATEDPTPGSPLEGLTPPYESPAEADPKKDCDTAISRFRADRMTAAKSRTILEIRPDKEGQVPFECTLAQSQFAIDSGRDWPVITYTWKASALCYKPLYFEQAHMERYGHSWGPVLDPVLSGAHFFATLPVLPYKMGVETPCECIYPLGYYRPGSCAPRYIEPWPVSIRGALLEAGAITGLSAALP